MFSLSFNKIKHGVKNGQIWWNLKNARILTHFWLKITQFLFRVNFKHFLQFQSAFRFFSFSWFFSVFKSGKIKFFWIFPELIISIFYLNTLGPHVSQRKEFPADILILCQNSTRSRPCLLAENQLIDLIY